jgi:hypothetical protein
VTLRTQADVEALRNVGTMLSTLEITGSIEDLSPLRCLTNGPVAIVIHDTMGLASLRGLEGIESLEGNLEIRRNGDLESLEGLRVESASGLVVDGNPILTDLDGLSSLTSLRMDLELHRNDALVDITGLGSLKELGGRFYCRFNARLASLEGLQNITRALSVGVEGNPLLTSVDGLRGLREVAGLYLESNPMLTSFDGLEALVFVQDVLWLFGNSNVTTLAGLRDLRIVGSLHLAYMSSLESLAGLEYVEILSGVSIHNNDRLVTTSGLNLATDGPGASEIGVVENPRLTSLEGFSGVASEVGNVSISDNESLASLHGLEGIVSATTVQISWNPALSTLDGLDGLTTVSDFVSIDSNDALTSLEGLGSLREGGLAVTSNASLTSLAGLESMRSTLAVAIGENPMLRSLRALAGLETVENDFWIVDNAVLPTCEAFWLVASVGVTNIGGTIDIEQNDDGGTCPEVPPP